MQTKWGKKNLELTITGDKTTDATFLFVVEKMVCDRNYLDSLGEARLKATQRQLHDVCKEMAVLKAKYIATWFKKYFW